MTLKINSGKISRAQKAVIYGCEGIGKSTLAAQFPEPLFIDLEDGTAQMDVRRIEPPQNWAGLVDLLRQVAANPDVCKTLAIDTVDTAERLCVEYVCKLYSQKSIESFGFGKGYTVLAEEWAKMLAACDSVVAAGINVVLLAHAKQRKMELPDEAGAFDRWELKLTRQVAPLTKEWGDMLLFINYKTFVVDGKASGGKRVIYTSHHPCWDAKNRHGLPDEMPLDYGGLAHIFGGGKLPQLRQMIAVAGLRETEVERIVAERGKCQAGTALADMPQAVLEWTIKYFENIVKMIKEAQA